MLEFEGTREIGAGGQTYGARRLTTNKTPPRRRAGNYTASQVGAA